MRRQRRETVPPLSNPCPLGPMSEAVEADKRRRQNPYIGARNAMWAANAGKNPTRT